MFNLSLQTGCIPTQLKTAKVVPIFKSGDKHNFTNLICNTGNKFTFKLFKLLLFEHNKNTVNNLKSVFRTHLQLYTGDGHDAVTVDQKDFYF